MRKPFRLLLCIGLIATACSDGRVTETDNGAAVRWIDVDGRTNRFNGSFLAFFPDQVTLHPGDTVVFRSIATGEPHTVTMGTLVDRTLAKEPGAPSLPRWTLGESSFLPANVGKPCYLESGEPPSDPRQSCEAVDKRPAFNGKQTYFSSGFLPGETEYRVQLDEKIEGGTYRFMCSFHGPKMSGAIRVVPEDEKIPDQGALDTAAKDKLREFVDSTIPVHNRVSEPFEDARAGRFPWPALASFDTNKGRVKVNEFVPFTLKAKVREHVTWNILGAHVISFEPFEAARPPAIRIRNTGETELKQDAINESRSPNPPDGAPKKRLRLDAPPYDDGFLSSGMLFSPKRGLITYTVRFTEPGTYRYECLLHPRMTGLVTVSV